MAQFLLITDEMPGTHYGSGQRVLVIYRALSALGECRILHLAIGKRPIELNAHHFDAPVPFDFHSSRTAWTLRYLTFAEYRKDRRYHDLLVQIKRQFSYDIAFCSFFRTACVAPTDLVPCMLDIDAIPDRTGVIQRALWPLSQAAMRQRLKSFDALYVIRPSDALMIGKTVSKKLKLLPGISTTTTKVSSGSTLKNNVLLVGPTHWGPNREAVNWILSIGVPEILSQSGYQLRLVGSGTETIPERQGLSCGGFVDDLAEEYARAALVICPIFSGGGANIKLAEAVQSGCAVLASEHAALGYEGILIPSQHLEVFSDKDLFLNTLQNILRKTDRLDELRAAARDVGERYLNQHYINGIIAADVNRILYQDKGRSLCS